MKDSDLLEQNHRNTTALAFSDFGTKFCEQSFYVSPLNVSAGRARKDQFKSALVLPLHAAMVLRRGTDVSGGSSDGYRLRRPPFFSLRGLRGGLGRQGAEAHETCLPMAASDPLLSFTWTRPTTELPRFNSGCARKAAQSAHFYVERLSSGI